MILDEHGNPPPLPPPTIPPQPEPISRSSEPYYSPSLFRQFLCKILGLHVHRRAHRPGYIGSKCMYCPDEYWHKIPPSPPRRGPRQSAGSFVPPHNNLPPPPPIARAFIDETALEYAHKVEAEFRRHFIGGDVQRRAAIQTLFIEFANKIKP